MAVSVFWEFPEEGKVKKSFMEEGGLKPVFKRWLKV